MLFSRLLSTMATRQNKKPAPVTFDLSLDLLAKIEVCRKELDAESASEVIRAALDQFDFAGCQPEVVPHRQISVRLSAEQRANLKRFARVKGVSVGELLRMAVEAMSTPKPKKKKVATKKKKTAAKKKTGRR